jgi:RNase P subunit RPR2
MKAMFEARIEHLGPGDYVNVECLACGHIERLTGAVFKTAGVPDYEWIVDLNRRLRCRECDAKGRVDVSIKWAS